MIVNPSAAVPVVACVYSERSPVCSTVYSIALPAFLTGRSFQVLLQLSLASTVILSPVAAPSALSCKLTDAGRIPSWLSASSHATFAVTEVTAVLWVNVSVVPFVPLV